MKRILIALMALLAVPSAQAGWVQKGLMVAGGVAAWNAIQNTSFGAVLSTIVSNAIGIPSISATPALTVDDFRKIAAEVVAENSKNVNEVLEKTIKATADNTSAINNIIKYSKYTAATVGGIAATATLSDKLLKATLGVSLANLAVSGFNAAMSWKIFSQGRQMFGKLVGLEQIAQEHKADIARANAGIAEAKDAIADVNKNVGDAQKEIAVLKVQLEEAKNNINENSKEILTQLQQKISALEKIINTQASQNKDEILDAYKTQMTQITDILQELIKQQQKLPESLLDSIKNFLNLNK